MSPENKTGAKSKQVAFCGMAAALSVVLMMLASVIPIFGYIGPMAASVLLIPLMKNFGKGAAALTWLVSSLLILILGADKEAAFFYIFFGCYPVLKTFFDKIKTGPARRLCKFAYFLLAAVVMDLILIKVLGITMEGELPPDQAAQLGISADTLVLVGEGIFCLIVVATMALFDILLSRFSHLKILNKKL